MKKPTIEELVAFQNTQLENSKCGLKCATIPLQKITYRDFIKHEKAILEILEEHKDRPRVTEGEIHQTVVDIMMSLSQHKSERELTKLFKSKGIEVGNETND